MDIKQEFREEKNMDVYATNVNDGSFSNIYVKWLEAKLTLTDVVGQSEQLVCDNKCEWTRYPKNGIWYDGCVKCGKEVAN